MNRKFYLLLAGISVIFIVGIINLMMKSTVVKRIQDLRRKEFIEKYAPEDDRERYTALFQKARRHLKELDFAEADHMGFVGGAAVTIGILLFLWAIDRHRLVKRIAPKKEKERCRE